MAFIETQSVDQACSSVRELYARQQDYWGYVPNYAKLFSHRPESLARWGKLLAELRRPISDRRYELVTLAAALALRSTPCALAHGHALAKLCDDETVLAIAQCREAEVLNSAEVAMIRFARAVAIDATAVTATHISDLQAQGFCDAEIFDFAALAAARSFLTKLMDALGCQADSALPFADGALNDALTVGRPVDGAPVERLSPQHAERSFNLSPSVS